MEDLIRWWFRSEGFDPKNMGIWQKLACSKEMVEKLVFCFVKKIFARWRELIVVSFYKMPMSDLSQLVFALNSKEDKYVMKKTEGGWPQWTMLHWSMVIFTPSILAF